MAYKCVPDFANWSQKALSASSALLSVSVTPPMCISFFVIMPMLILQYGLFLSQLCNFSSSWFIVFKIPSISCLFPVFLALINKYLGCSGN